MLIGKNPEKKNEPEYRKVNSVTFRIVNSGKFNASLKLALMSSVIDNNPLYKKNIFFLEYESMDIPKDDIPHEIRVWAIPDEAKKFKDEIIVMIKDNPQPLIVPITCTGAKPIVDIIDGEPMKFDRLLLK